MGAALDAVKRALGPDAVLLAIETSAGGETVVTASGAAVTPPAPDGARIELVMGAPGDGKTTTLGKLAVAARRAGHAVLLVATDTRRVGAAFELEALARTIGASVRIAVTPAEVVEAVDANPATERVLIDTTGAGAAGAAGFAEVAAITRALGARARRTLVVSATNAPAVVAGVCEAYAVLGPTRAVVTKTDLAPWEPIASQIIRLGVPVAGCSRSRSVADDVASVDRSELARRLLSA